MDINGVFIPAATFKPSLPFFGDETLRVLAQVNREWSAVVKPHVDSCITQALLDKFGPEMKLDEIDMPPRVQWRLVKVLDKLEVRRTGCRYPLEMKDVMRMKVGRTNFPRPIYTINRLHEAYSNASCKALLRAFAMSELRYDRHVLRFEDWLSQLRDMGMPDACISHISPKLPKYMYEWVRKSYYDI